MRKRLILTAVVLGFFAVPSQARGRLATRLFGPRAAACQSGSCQSAGPAMQSAGGNCANGVCTVAAVETTEVIVGTDATAVAALVNQHRAERGLQPLALDAQLSGYAEGWSQTMSRSGFRHSSGWVQFGGLEVIGMGHSSPADIVRGWMNSRGHRDALMSPGVSRFGLGRVGSLWTGLTGR